MRQRPLSVTIISWLFILSCGALFAAHLIAPHPFDLDATVAYLSLLLAVVGGAFLLHGHNWARWLLVAWMAAHIALGVRHSTSSAVLHALLFTAIAYGLFRPPAAAFFRRPA